MKRLLKLFLTLAIGFLALDSLAVDKITASITLTNTTTNGMTFTLNGSARTWTNNVVISSTQILTNLTGSGSKTNLLNQIALNQVANISLVDTGTNSFKVIGASGIIVTATASAGYASIVYSTQTVAVATPVGVPATAYYPTPSVRTNVHSLLILDVNFYSTNALDQNSTAASQLLGLGNNQSVTGRKYFLSASGAWSGYVSNSPGISGVAVDLTNGNYQTPILNSPTLTNGVNYSNAFSSPACLTCDTPSEQFGAGAIATGVGSLAIVGLASGNNSIAIGSGSTATNGSSTALGVGALALGSSSTAIGTSAQAQDDSATAIGAQAEALKPNSTAIGNLSVAQHTNSTAIGYSATTTANNQLMLGSPGISTVVQNNLTIQTNIIVGGGAAFGGSVSNLTTTGTNNFPAGADIAFGRYALTSLANGNNAAIPIGTNVFVEVSGPSGAFTINGIAGGRDGKLVILVNQTGQDMTIAHQSGTDPTAANRIINMTGADRTTTANGTATLIYSATASRWILVNFDP